MPPAHEVVWYQQLQLVLGSTTIALAILLATFMGGLCLGSLILPRVPLRGWEPLKVFAAIEAGIAICGVLVTFTIPLVARGYLAGAEGSSTLSLRSVLSALIMLPATVSMGASFPAIVRAVERRTDRFAIPGRTASRHSGSSAVAAASSGVAVP
jgi:spermidine synthase